MLQILHNYYFFRLITESRQKVLNGRSLLTNLKITYVVLGQLNNFHLFLEHFNAKRLIKIQILRHSFSICCIKKNSN